MLMVADASDESLVSRKPFSKPFNVAASTQTKYEDGVALLTVGPAIVGPIPGLAL